VHRHYNKDVGKSPFNSIRVQLSSRVGKGFVETGGLIEFAGLENRPAVQAFDILCVLILGDQLRAGMLAG
jgi:hypothetical protein